MNRSAQRPVFSYDLAFEMIKMILSQQLVSSNDLALILVKRLALLVGAAA